MTTIKKDDKTLNEYMNDKEALSDLLRDIYSDIEVFITKATGKKDEKENKRLFYRVITALLFTVHRNKGLTDFVKMLQEQNPKDETLQGENEGLYIELIQPFVDEYSERLKHISMANYLNTLKMAGTTGALSQSYTLFLTNRIFNKNFLKVAGKYLPPETKEYFI